MKFFLECPFKKCATLYLRGAAEELVRAKETMQAVLVAEEALRSESAFLSSIGVDASPDIAAPHGALLSASPHYYFSTDTSELAAEPSEPDCDSAGSWTRLFETTLRRTPTANAEGSTRSDRKVASERSRRHAALGNFQIGMRPRRSPSACPETFKKNRARVGGNGR